mgnify:CR=1 FL=1
MKREFIEPKNTDVELAYFAGIVDGEGSITISDCSASQGKMHFVTQFSLSSTDLVLIEWTVNHFGGKYKKYTPAQLSVKSRKNVYKYSATGPRLEYILKAVMPYLIIKKHEAKIMLKMRETFKREHRVYLKQKNNNTCYPKLKEGILEIRLNCIAELKKLHCRNYNTYSGSHSFKKNKN